MQKFIPRHIRYFFFFLLSRYRYKRHSIISILTFLRYFLIFRTLCDSQFSSFEPGYFLSPFCILRLNISQLYLFEFFIFVKSIDVCIILDIVESYESRIFRPAQSAIMCNFVRSGATISCKSSVIRR